MKKTMRKIKKELEKKNLKLEDNNTFKELSFLKIEEVLKKFNSSLNGLEEHQVEENREKYGENVIIHGKKKNLIRKITEAFINPFTTILFCLVIISIVTDIIIPLHTNSPEDVSYTTVIIITTMVMISGFLRFIQESKSSNAAEKLTAMITTTASIKRAFEDKKEIDIKNIVVGDIIFFAAGDMIPADVRIIQSKDFFVSQSSLTGESEPVEKIPEGTNSKEKSITELENIIFMGSNVISGSAVGIVVSVGNNTVFGKIAELIAEDSPASSFEKGVNSVSWILIRFMLVMVPVVFFINGFTKGSWIQALLFAISVAVGLTPEMLPMIVTTSLAKGAVSMAKKKTIIKNLNSIQNFGSIDILCTDKTGTITQDKVVLEYHMDVHGKEDNRVLRHAFLNSWFQTGLKNLLDLSIIEKTNEESIKDFSLKNIENLYTKIDEIPFDFSRRRMTVVVEDRNKKTQMITKGAVEEILSICKFVEYNGNIEILDKNLREEIMNTVRGFNEDGLRVIAVAQKNNPSPIEKFSVKDEEDMVLIGYLAFLDPPKPTTAAAINALKEYGVTTKVLTGDNDQVTKSICGKVGINIDEILLGSDIDKMTDEELGEKSETISVFAKLSPAQKTRVVKVLRNKGHIVGFMGDGINDASAMKEADIGISVDTAVDIAKEAADIILLEKDLMVLEEGIIEGRKTYANMIKYIKMTASSNFGNMFSVLIASAFIPFLPMMSIHLIVLNLIYDLSCTAIPWDNVDKEFLKVPRKWDASSIGKFMLWIGPTSSIFDITTYIIMYFIICPMFSHGLTYHMISNEGTREIYEAMFQTGWFIESMWTQTFVIHMIRTSKIPFIQSRASKSVFFMTMIGIGMISILPYTPLATILGLVKLPLMYWFFLLLTIVAYTILVTFVKKKYIKYYGEFL